MSKYNWAYGSEGFEVLVCSVFLFTVLGKFEEEQIRGRWQGTDVGVNGNQNLSFGHINSEKPVRHPGGNFEKLISQ